MQEPNSRIESNVAAPVRRATYQDVLDAPDWVCDVLSPSTRKVDLATENCAVRRQNEAAATKRRFLIPPPSVALVQGPKGE